MITDDLVVQAEVFRLEFLLPKHGCRPLDDRQAVTIAKHILELRCKIDDLGDERDELQEQIDYMEKHPKGCECRDCRIP